jgi:hypothetical protein
MTPRRVSWTGKPINRRQASRVGLTAGALLALGIAGCDPRQAMYFLQPFEPQIKPPCPSLNGKKVAVLARASATVQSEYVPLDQELAQRLAKALREKVRKVEVVELSKVRAWAEQHPTATDPAEAARAFDADVVIYLELLDFKIESPESPGMFSGHSRVYLRATELKYPEVNGKPVTERPKEAETIHEAEVETEFPRVQGSLPAEINVSRTGFRKRFLDVIGNEISWHFVAHGAADNFQSIRFVND